VRSKGLAGDVAKQLLINMALFLLLQHRSASFLHGLQLCKGLVQLVPGNLILVDGSVQCV
jgi:hypothetical protein